MTNDVDRTIDQLTAMPVAERLKVVEAVWNSLAAESVPVSMSPEQRAELNRRLDAYEADPQDVLTWGEFLARLRERL